MTNEYPYAAAGAVLWQMRQEAGAPTQAEVADLIGISHRSYSDYERGVRPMPPHKIAALKTALEAHQPAQAYAANAYAMATKSLTTQDRGNPVYDLEASAGDGSVIDTERIVGTVPSRIRGGYWITAVGDSMAPTISANSAIQAVPFNGQLEDIRADGVYLFRLESGLHIKRLQLLPGRRVRVVSDNERYAAYELAIDEGVDFEVIGRVIP